MKSALEQAISRSSALKIRRWDSSSAQTAWMKQLHPVVREITTLIPHGDRFILADRGQLGFGENLLGRRAHSLIESNGTCLGAPPDDAMAVRELERLRSAGASYMVLPWPAFWWLDHYRDLHQHLRSTYRRVVANDHLIAFDLQS